MKECPNCGKCLDDNGLDCPHDGSTLTVSLDGPRLIDGKYRIMRCLGKGGMGSVYLAQHVELQKNFALKLILHSALSDPANLARFRTEAKALGKLQHPNIVQVTDYGIDSRNGGIPYLVMEYLEGTTMRNHLRNEGALDIKQAIPILESIASAIDYAHACGILHRDLKLKNIFLVQDSSDKMFIKILDFGLARMAGKQPQRKKGEISKLPILPADYDQEYGNTITLIAGGDRERDSSEEESNTFSSDESEIEELDRLTQAGTVLGTPGYIAPELLRGNEATKASDIYSFGILIYEILVGHHPFKNTAYQREEPDSLPIPSEEQESVPRELNQPLLAPLQKDPDKRPKKAIDVISKVQNAYDEYKFRLWRDIEIPKRIRMAGILTIVFILLLFILPGLPFFTNMDNYLVDLRFRLIPQHPPDQRILLLSIDEAALQSDPSLIGEKADEMGGLLQRILDVGARGIAIDFILPERWNMSESFAKLVLQNQEKVILASYIKEDGSILGMECIKGLIMAAIGSFERAQDLFGFLNIQPDPDGRIRRTDLEIQSQDEGKTYSMPARAYEILTGNSVSDKQIVQRLWIDYSIDWNSFQRISWKDLVTFLNERPDFFKDKMVLIGGEYEGSQDFHRIPERTRLNDEISGLVIQALTLNTLLQDKLIHVSTGYIVFLPMAAVFMFFSAVFLIRPKVFPFVALFLMLSAGYFISAFILFILNRQLLPVASPLLILILAIMPLFLTRRKLTFVVKPSAEGKKK